MDNSDPERYFCEKLERNKTNKFKSEEMEHH